MDEIEVRVRPVVETQDMDSLQRELAKQAERVAAETFARMTRGAIASQAAAYAQARAVSTADAPDGETERYTWVTGHWRRVPARRKRRPAEDTNVASTGEGATGGDRSAAVSTAGSTAGGSESSPVVSTGDGGGGVGGGRGSRDYAASRRGRTTAITGPARQSYLADVGPINRLSGFVNDPLSGVMTAVNLGGDALRKAAKARAEAIESGSIPGGIGALGLLRYANPITAAAAAVTMGAGKAIRESSTTGDKYAAIARDLAYGAAGGGFPSFTKGNYFDTTNAILGAARWYLAPDEMASRMKIHAETVGYERHRPVLDLWRLWNTSASDSAISGYVANQRLGARADDVSRAVGLAQSVGLFGSGIDNYLRIIASATQRMAMRGVMLSDSATLDVLTAFRNTRGLADFAGERGAQGISGLQERFAAKTQQALDPWASLGDLQLTREAMRQAGGSMLGYFKAREALTRDPMRMIRALGRGLTKDTATMVYRASMPEATWANAEALAAGQLGDSREVFAPRTLDRIIDASEPGPMIPLMHWTSPGIAQAAREMRDRPRFASYEAEKGRSEGWDTMWRDIGNGINNIQAWLNGQEHSLETNTALLRDISAQLQIMNARARAGD
jgi:hypothetical protein